MNSEEKKMENIELNDDALDEVSGGAWGEKEKDGKAFCGHCQKYTNFKYVGEGSVIYRVGTQKRCDINECLDCHKWTYWRDWNLYYVSDDGWQSSTVIVG